MSVRTLERLFDPRSIAVLGASNTAQRVGSVLMRNLLEGGFSGPIMPVNPKYRAVCGVLAYKDVASLPVTPDLAVVATPPATVPRLIDEIGKRGIRAAIVITDRLERRAETGGTLRDAMLAAAAPYGLRILGTRSLGLLVPRIGLNASFSHVKAHAGKIAFVSQSGALCTAVLDWARPKGIGFSHFVSLGASDDVDFGDVLDMLGSDQEVRAILLYIEEIRARRNFVAAARTAARNKPVLVVKAGQGTPADQAARVGGITEAMIGGDDVFDAVIRRAGMLRVSDIDELFAAVETLARVRRMAGDRLAVMANGGGLGVMAVDALSAGGGRLAALSDTTVRQLDGVLAKSWSHTNPVDMEVGSAPERYAGALEALIADKAAVDATLVLHAPSALASSEGAANAVIDTVRQRGGIVLTSWIGGEAVAAARHRFAEAGVPTYDTPRQAVRAFLHMVHYSRNQQMLMQTPPSAATEFAPRLEEARAAVARAGTGVLSGPAAMAVLAAYGVPVVESAFARSPEEAAERAAAIGFPVVLGILSTDVPHKWEVGGIAMHLGTREAVVTAARAMIDKVREIPGASVDGVSVQRMVSRLHARQVMIGVATDPMFGPVIVFGDGGRSADMMRDHAVGLPPLNLPLAANLISRTRVMRVLEAHHGRPAIDFDALGLTLVKISQLVVDIPQIVAIDINPVLVDETGVLVVDADIRIDAQAPTGPKRLSIQPYPKGLEEEARLRDGRTVLMRPIRPEDEEMQQGLVSHMTQEDLRFRFFRYVKALPHMEMARLTQIDYDREMAFVATVTAPGGAGPDGAVESLGVVRTVTDPDNTEAEFSVLVRSDLKGQGLGSMLMRKMIAYCRARGTIAMVWQVLAENDDMLRLARRLGFAVRRGPDEGTVEVELKLNAKTGATAP
jgi:acetyltransferase